MTKRLLQRVVLKAFASFSVLALTLLASGCMWGVVRDATTGAPISGAQVTYTDMNGVSATTTTDTHGLFSFAIPGDTIPAAGPVSFDVTAATYEDLTAARMCEYNDNPGASIVNLTSFWEVQAFNMVPHLVQRVSVELQNVDVDQATLALPTSIVTYYVVNLKVFDPADLATAVCEQTSPATPTTVVDPPPLSLGFECDVPGDDFRALVTVVLVRQWMNPAPPNNIITIVHTSTSAFDWVAPEENTAWDTATLNSSDATGPDQNADIQFEAQIRYKSTLAQE